MTSTRELTKLADMRQAAMLDKRITEVHITTERDDLGLRFSTKYCCWDCYIFDNMVILVHGNYEPGFKNIHEVIEYCVSYDEPVDGGGS